MLSEEQARIAAIAKKYATLIRLTRERETLIDAAVAIVSSDADLDVAEFRAACQPDEPVS